MADLGKAYVQIIPKAEGITQKIQGAVSPGAEKAGSAAGSKLVGNIKKAITVAAIGAPIVAGVKAALDEGGKLQQSFGGLDTIYGDASEAAKNYAKEAAAAGISMNDYAEQAVSFGASLKQAFEGDTSKAVEAANTAILDMTDNAAKMGTPLESIQNAYQGFAKQNYTMLDNLKLGYVGTKTEMQRLLADAEQISGVKYDIGNLGDVYSAIHVIQGELGLTGVAADEAKGTFTGSMGAMQAAAKNLAASLTTGEGIEESITVLAGNAATFLTNNLIPMIGRVFKSLPTAIKTFITAGLPQFIESGRGMITSLISGVQNNLPTFLAKAQELISGFATSITENLPTLLSKGIDFIVTLANGILQNIPQMAATAGEIITNVANFIGQNLPTIGEKGGELIQRLVTGIINNLPSIISAAGRLGLTLIQNIIKIIPKILKAGADIVKGLIKGIGNATPVKNAMNKIKKAITDPIDKAKSLVKGIIDKIKGFFPLNLGNIFNLKLPHFSISGGTPPFGLMGKGSMPSWSVSWYAKAMDTPYMFTQPTLFGAGEAGNEIMYGRDNLMRDIREAVGNGGGNTYINITVDGAEAPEDYARRLARELQLRTRMA